MDLTTQFIFGIIFGVIGFIIYKIYGFNPETIYSNLASIMGILPVFLILLRIAINPETAHNSVDDFLNWYVSYLPSAIIGTIIGNIVGLITREL